MAGKCLVIAFVEFIQFCIESRLRTETSIEMTIATIAGMAKADMDHRQSKTTINEMVTSVMAIKRTGTNGTVINEAVIGETVIVGTVIRRMR